MIFFIFLNNMPKSKAQKQDISRLMGEKIEQSKTVIFSAFNGLGVKENENLREAVREAGGEYYAAKKTLLKRVLEEKNYEGLETADFAGQVAVTFSFTDEVAPAKALADFIKANEGKVSLLGGIMEGRYIDSSAVTALATLPSKPELYAKLVGSINAPVSGFVNVLAGNLRSLVRVLSAIQESRS